MKKSIIAAGAASVALAAMPIVGVFAAGGSVTDNISATLTPGCTIASSTGNNVNITLVPGSTVTTPDVSSANFTCNNSTWTVSAIGVNAGKDNVNSLYSGDNEIATGTETSGAASNWAFRISGLGTGITDDDAEIAADDDEEHEGAGAYDYSEWSGVPATSATVVTGKRAATIAMTTQYRVYTATNQAGGTYTGAVTYTLAENI